MAVLAALWLGLRLWLYGFGGSACSAMLFLQSGGLLEFPKSAGTIFAVVIGGNSHHIIEIWGHVRRRGGSKYL
jgi:hypothetical protein